MKLCPFCKGNAYYGKFYIDTHFIACHKCGATIMGKTKQDVLDKWNKRAK